MAIKKTEVLKHQKEFKDRPLTEKELNAISIIENYIDNEILKLCNSGKTVIKIDLGYVNFNYHDIVDIMSDMRVDKMRDEIDRRYKNAGWKIKVEYDDSFLNNGGLDYWILY